jgi:hypothetical protein
MTADATNALYAGTGSTPVPDPTVLTSAALVREVSALREILEAKIAGDVGIINARLEESYKATVLLQARLDRVPDQIEAKILSEFPGIEILIHPDPEGHVDKGLVAP